MKQDRQNTVAVNVQKGALYPVAAPFHPSEPYPEYPFLEISTERNHAYEMVRDCLTLLEYDKHHVGLRKWNPLDQIVRPGDLVLVKPNLIKEAHQFDQSEWQSVMTHGSIIRAVTDYVILALKGRGKIIIADAPQTDSSFAKIAERNGLKEIISFYRRYSPVPVELLDLRQEEWEASDDVIVNRKRLIGDPAGYVRFDLREMSEFATHGGNGKYYGADYDLSVINYHHSNGRHEYLISKSAITADVVINIPKLKTHKKTGITCSLKNLVGINGDKNWLPHYTIGDPTLGGDQFPEMTLMRRIENIAVDFAKSLSLSLPSIGPQMAKLMRRGGVKVFGHTKDTIRSGNWWGNDTTWRMVLDLNKILFYGKPDGNYSSKRWKRYFSLVDGIIGGEGNGPLAPTPVYSGALIGGMDPVAVDAVCAKFMGYDYRKLKSIFQAFEISKMPITDTTYDEIHIVSNDPQIQGDLKNVTFDSYIPYEPHFGWKGHIEVDN